MQGGELIMVEVWRARTAPRAAQEKNQASSACLMPSTFMLGPPPSDRTLMSTRYKSLQGSTLDSTTVVGGGPASALLETALPVRFYFPSTNTISKLRARHSTRNGQGYNATLGPTGACGTMQPAVKCGPPFASSKFRLYPVAGHGQRPPPPNARARRGRAPRGTGRARCSRDGEQSYT